MMTWTGFLAWLTSLAADPSAPEVAHPRAAAAVLVARASLTPAEASPTPPKPDPGPKPTPDKCATCQGTGWIVHGDGHRTPCPDCQKAPTPQCSKCNDTGWVKIDEKTRRRCDCQR